MITKLMARQKRFWHCAYHAVIRFNSGHCMHDLFYYDPDTQKMCAVIGCTCGEVFYSDDSAAEEIFKSITKEDSQ